MGSQTTSPSDEELVTAAKKGDRQAFSQLVERYQDRIYDLACRTLGHPTRAQDVAQEAFIRAWRALAAFKGDAKFSSWLYRITVNCCFSELRRRGIPLDPLPDQESNFPQRALTAPEKLDITLEKHDLVERLLNSLTPKNRQIVVLHYLHGQSCEEISHITQQPVGTIKAYLHRARAQMRDQARELFNLGDPAK